MTENPDVDQELITVSESGQGSGLMLPEQVLPHQLYLIPLRDRPFFPAQVHPVVIPDDPWLETLEQVEDTVHQNLGICYVGKADLDDLHQDDFPHINCVTKIRKLNVDQGRVQFIAQGIKRFRIRHWLSDRPPFLVEVDYPEPVEERPEELKAYAMAIIQVIKELLPLNPLYGEELKFYLDRFSPNQPSPLADFGASLTTAKGDELQAVLETLSLAKRMEKVLVLLRQEIEVARLRGEIHGEVERKISNQQREFFLREQLKVIQKELGISKDDRTADLDSFRERLAPLTLPAAVEQRIGDELRKLSILETGSPEYGTTRNYLDWITSVPWGRVGEDRLALDNARKVLDKHHDGLEDVKLRILEFLALGTWRGEVSGSIMLLIGPPGVGKTSIGRSIAEALGRPFYRFSLGGMRDEAEIKGHRRTYIGALPGKMVQALKDVEVMNPVIMLDEIDKLGASYQGDPASALLEVLDPEQNVEFLDHYLDVRLDLSKVLFICTANQLDTIPGPLLDRMEIIRLSGYLTDEKVAIAKHHLWPRMLKRAKVKRGQVSIHQAALRRLIEGYARESGVRQLEKLLQKILRKAVMRLLDGREREGREREANESDRPSAVGREQNRQPARVQVNTRNLVEFVGEPYFRKETLMKGVGVVTGLAWTSLGGATLPVEANLVHRVTRGFKLTGKLGEVMRESAEIAYSYVFAECKRYGVDPELFEKGFVHLHVPEGATPKDGPSAGITMATALISLGRRQQLSRSLGMTGELTLTGQVLPVGGIREKVVAAKRSGLRELILPEANRRDFDELPDPIRAEMTIHFAKHYLDVFRVVFD